MGQNRRSSNYVKSQYHDPLCTTYHLSHGGLFQRSSPHTNLTYTNSQRQPTRQKNMCSFSNFIVSIWSLCTNTETKQHRRDKYRCSIFPSLVQRVLVQALKGHILFSFRRKRFRVLFSAHFQILHHPETPSGIYHVGEPWPITKSPDQSNKTTLNLNTK